MVLAAGLGTRLRPLSDVRAKPLFPVGDRPALAHVLDRLHAAEVSRVVVNAHHHTDQVRVFVSERPGTRLSVETELLGTAGGIACARDLLGEGDVLVWNADILADIDIAALVAAHRESATLVVQPLGAGAGSVGLDAAGRIVRLRQERFGAEVRGGQFLGVHVLGAALRSLLPERGGLIEDVYVPALARGAILRAFPYEGAWHDIGTVASYLEANAAWLARRGAGGWAGPGAVVGEAVLLEESVVGEGATVTGQGTLRNCVVWPGAHAVAPLAGRVVTA
jgi:mannose-1-phosphate guanylyltransferase